MLKKSDPTSHHGGPAGERRRHGRLRQRKLSSNLGEVLEMSVSGMRVVSRHRLEGEQDVILQGSYGGMVTLRARPVWNKRLGFRQHIIGLQFINLSPQAATELTRIRTNSLSGNTHVNITTSGTTVRRRGQAFMILGLALVALGSVLNVPAVTAWLGTRGLEPGSATLLFLKNFIGLIGGISLLVFGVALQLIGLIKSGKTHRPRKELSRVVEELGSTRELLQSILESSMNGVMVLKAVRDDTQEVVDFECRLINTAGEQLLGRSESQMVGKKVCDVLPCVRSEGLLQEAAAVVKTGLPFKDQRLLNHDGRWHELAVVKLGDGVAVTFADVHQQKQAEAKLRHAVMHDTLTGLPNRKYFMERLEQALHRNRRFKNGKCAVLFVDCDGFKSVNDTLGHEVGDQLLIGIAKRLRDNLRAVDSASRVEDNLVPARLGGDEFVVLLDGIGASRDAVAIAQRLMTELAVPYKIAGQQIVSMASVGIAVSDTGYDKADDMLRDADAAMYKAKTSGKGRFVVFDSQMHQAMAARMKLEKELRAAVEQGHLEVEYEPIIALDSGTLMGFEALVRWPHEQRGVIPPGQFIGIAEELGLITPLGRWVLENVCRQMRLWHDRFPEHPDLFVSVNLSKHQLRDPHLIEFFQELLSKSGVSAHSLRLEITESMIMDDLDEMTRVLGRIKALGIQLAMDDFGTGHSSLNCLHRFPLDILKVDRSFISGEETTARQYAAIIHATMELAHNLNMRVVAEGIETQSQLTMLQGIGCDYGQGWLFSGPLSAQTATDFIEHRQSNQAA